MKRFVKACKALGDPARLSIVLMLAAKPLCVCEMVSVLGLAQSTVSKHLKVLEEAGLVVWERRGTFVNYALAQEAEFPVEGLLDLARSLPERDAQAERTVRQALAANRADILCRGGGLARDATSDGHGAAGPADDTRPQLAPGAARGLADDAGARPSQDAPEMPGLKADGPDQARRAAAVETAST